MIDFPMRSLLLTILLLLSLPQASLAIDEFGDIKVIREIPVSEFEVKSAYRRCRADSCEQVPVGEPQDLGSFMTYLTTRDRHLSKGPPLPSIRKGALSIGLEIRGRDKTDLPALSRSQILDYIEKNYLTIQTRIRKDLLDRKLYYHHRPVAATCSYFGSRLTQKFEPLVAITTRDIRSLGVFVDPQVNLVKAEHLRTIVLLFPCQLLDPTTNRTNDDYEWVIIRGVETNGGAALEPHVFVSKDSRARLVHLRSFTYPKRGIECGVLASIAITSYDRTGIFPTEAATRTYRVATRDEYTWQQLETYSNETFDAGINVRLSSVLDDIIAGKITAAPPALETSKAEDE